MAKVNTIANNGLTIVENYNKLLEQFRKTKTIDAVSYTHLNYNDSFKTPVLTAGQSFILGYTSEVDGIYAVSYTHLDVYKRQPMPPSQWVKLRQ